MTNCHSLWTRLDGKVASVGVIRIEPEDPVKENPCSTCGGTNRLMHGYVYDDEHARLKHE